MAYTIQISKAIISEVDQAVQWYESKEKGLGDRFENEFKTKLARIKDNPKLFQEIEANQRRAVLSSSFPFTVHYLVNDKTRTVKIIGVFHQSKNIELVNENIKIRKIHELRQEKIQKLSQREQQLKQLRKRQNLEKNLGRERDRGLER